MTAVKACRILGVPSRTTWSDVRQAYLDLVKVWHPDRFQSDPSLQARAAKRLAEINDAYEFLRDVHTSRRSSNASRPRTAPKPSPTPQKSNTESSPPRPPENTRAQQAPAEPPSPPIPDAGQIIGRVLSVGVIIITVAVLVVLAPTLRLYLGTQQGDAPSSRIDTPGAPTLVAPAHGSSFADDLVQFGGRIVERPSASKWLGADDLASPLPLAQVPSPAPTPPTLTIAKAEPLPVYKAVYAQTVPGVERPESGAELIVAAETGLGSLNVRNGTNPDAVVILYQGDVQRRAAYIRASNAAVIPKVAAGTYNVRFTSGKWWNGEEFLKEATFSEFERPLVFAETQEEDGIAYSDFKLTLNRVIGGNARTRRTPPFKLSKQIPLEGR